jgi:hypothetical protein
MPRLAQNIFPFVLSRLLMPNALSHNTLRSFSFGGCAPWFRIIALWDDFDQKFHKSNKPVPAGAIPACERHAERQTIMNTTCDIDSPKQIGGENFFRRLEVARASGTSLKGFERGRRSGWV